MTKSKTDPKVDRFLDRATQWQEEFIKLRALLLGCGLTETLKWGQPCYTFQENNIVLMHGFKEYCALLFFKGALMKDPENILVQQTQNVQAGRQIRFTSAKEITKMTSILKAYVKEALEVEKAGLKVSFKKTTEFEVPEELQNKFDEDPDLKAAFDALTPGRQRGYLLHFSSAKQSKTRESRIEKSIPQILEGKGLDD
ncbi:MAG TPA: YdeI family protein [Rickettsiales bacterium]|nr:YdeI family protein [Rickettsiales bacterium]